VAYWLLNCMKIVDLEWLWRSLTTSTVGYPSDSWVFWFYVDKARNWKLRLRWNYNANPIFSNSRRRMAISYCGRNKCLLHIYPLRLQLFLVCCDDLRDMRDDLCQLSAYDYVSMRLQSASEWVRLTHSLTTESACWSLRSFVLVSSSFSATLRAVTQ